jgi:putative DNA methylase
VNRRRALKPRVERPRSEPPRVAFEVFDPKTEQEVPAGAVMRARATCLCCGTVLPPERVRVQLSSQRGGGDVVFDAQDHRVGGARLLAVVTLRPGEVGRHYRLPTERDYEVVRLAQVRIAKIFAEWEGGGKKVFCPVPDEIMNPIRPSPNARGLSAVTRYGMLAFDNLFTARQKMTLVTLVQLVRERPVGDDGAVREGMAIVIDKLADKASSGCRWKSSAEYMAGNTFSRQALPIVWDYCEANPLGDESGSISQELNWVAKVAEAWPGSRPSQPQLADATEHPLPDETAGVWFTDPPYYDAIPYADLSDFFLVWLKRSLPFNPLLRDPFDPENALTPKLRECVWNRAYSYEGRPKDKAIS